MIEGRESGRLVAGTLVIAAIGVATKLLGFTRDAGCAAVFGVERTTDVYFLVFNVWVVLCVVLSVSLSTLLVPTLARYGAERRNRGADHAVSIVVGLLIALGAATLALATFADSLMSAFAPALDTHSRALGVALIRITAPLLPLLSVSAVASAYLRTDGRFGWAESPVALLNLGSVVGVFLGSRNGGLEALAWGMTIGAAVGAGTVIVASWPVGHRASVSGRQALRAIPTLGTAAGLTAVGQSGGYVLSLVENFFTIRLPVGDLSVLAYGRRLVFLVPQIVMPAALTPSLTEMAEESARGADEEANRTATLTARLLLFVLAPCLVAVAVSSEAIVAVVFGRGRFGPEAIAATSLVVVAVSGIPVISILRNVFANRLFAAGRPRLIVMSGVVGIGVFAGVAGFTWTTWGLWGIITAQYVSEAVACLMLGITTSAICGLRFGSFVRTALKTALASLIAFLSAGVTQRYVGGILDGRTGDIATVSLAFAISFAVFWLMSSALRMEERRWARLWMRQLRLGLWSHLFAARKDVGR